MSTEILLADDHFILSKGMRKVLEFEFGYSNIQTVTKCSEVLKELNKKTYTHLILDIGLADGSSLEILPTINRLYPTLSILIFSGRPGVVYQRALSQYGIRNFLSKEECGERTMEALRRFFYRSGKENAVSEGEVDNPFVDLTAREMEVLHYILQGMGSNDIGDALNIKQNTVSTLKSRIFDKTAANNLKELLELAAIYNVS